MKALLILAVIGIVVYAIGSHDNGGSTRDSVPPPRPGDASVYSAILSTSDCSELQQMFDTADTNNNRHEPGSFLFKVTLSYMEASDDRLRDLNCY